MVGISIGVTISEHLNISKNIDENQQQITDIKVENNFIDVPKGNNELIDKDVKIILKDEDINAEEKTINNTDIDDALNELDNFVDDDDDIDFDEDEMFDALNDLDGLLVEEEEDKKQRQLSRAERRKSRRKSNAYRLSIMQKGELNQQAIAKEGVSMKTSSRDSQNESTFRDMSSVVIQANNTSTNAIKVDSQTELNPITSQARVSKVSQISQSTQQEVVRGSQTNQSTQQEIVKVPRGSQTNQSTQQEIVKAPRGSQTNQSTQQEIVKVSRVSQTNQSTEQETANVSEIKESRIVSEQPIDAKELRKKELEALAEVKKVALLSKQPVVEEKVKELELDPEMKKLLEDAEKKEIMNKNL